MAKKPSGKQNGKISQVIGAVVDVEFELGGLLLLIVRHGGLGLLLVQLLICIPQSTHSMR